MGFISPRARNELTLRVTLETPETARRLVSQVASLKSDMNGMEELLLEQFIDKDIETDLLLLTATQKATGRLVGLIFWRYLRNADDDYWKHVKVDWKAALGPNADSALVGNRPLSSAFVLEQLCTDRTFRGRGVGKLLLVTALAYSAVKDGKTAAVLTLGCGDDNAVARDLYEKLGFEPMDVDLVAKLNNSEKWRHVLVLWNIKEGLRSLAVNDVDGSKKGTRVPQLEDQNGVRLELCPVQRLNSGGCEQVVERLTEKSF